MSAPMQHEIKNSNVEDTVFLFHFSHDFVNFRNAELNSVAATFSIELKEAQEIKDASSCQNSSAYPYKLFKGLTQDQILLMASRCVSLRSVYEYWTEAASFDQILLNIKSRSKGNKDRDKSYKISIEPFNRTYANRNDVKMKKIEALAEALGMSGPVNLREPQVMYTLFEYHGEFGTQSTDEPINLYFGKLITESRREEDIKKFNIKSRKFIGNTSMDPTLSLIMANLARVRKNDLVLDPFVGTGSLLLSCAHYGAYTIGTDINKVLLHGRGRSSRHKQKWRERDENIRANFDQYKLSSQYIDVMVADASKHDMWCIDGLLDAVITDPPYGIREQTRKLEAPAPDVKKPDFMPSTTQYGLSEVFTDLLTLSSRCLRLGGHLVYWLPIFRPDYKEENIPKHPCFQLISNCEQVLSTNISRRLITMKKILEPSQVELEDFEAHIDHYTESFRDRYFQVSKNLDKLTLASQQSFDAST